MHHVTSSSRFNPVIGDVLITEDEIKERRRELAADVDAHYKGRDLVLLGVLRGAATC
jgi:hypoxanthine phosphoribosyltransferase